MTSRTAGHEWPKSDDVVARHMNNNYRKRNAFEVLLVLKIAIDRNQNLERRRREPQ